MAEKKGPITKQVPIKRIFPENLQTHFVTQMVVQHEPDTFIISFFEAFPPAIIAETPEEVKVEVEKIKQVEAKCVTRLVVTPTKMKEFVDVLTKNLNRYIKTYEFSEEETKR